MNTQKINNQETSIQPQLLATAPEEIIGNTIDKVLDGRLDPIGAYAAVCRMEAAIKTYKGNDAIRELTLREIEKHGQRTTVGGCTLEIRETGVRYDFSACGCSALDELRERRDSIDEEIKTLENQLKNYPRSGVVDPSTGELIFPPARSSKPTIAATFKRR